MQTQKDHVDAQAFLIGRLTAALVTGEASFLEAPARRTWTGFVVGAVLAVLVAVGFLVFALFTHGKG